MLVELCDMRVMHVKDLSPEELQAASLSEPEALSELIKRYLPLVKSRVLYFFGADSEFEDLVQEGYIGFLSAIQSYNSAEGTSFGYFAKLCIDRALGNYGKSKKHVTPAQLLPLDEELCAAGVGPESLAIIRDEYLSVANKAKTDLSVFEYTVFCYFINGYKNSEIAEIMSVPSKSVDNAVHRFKQKLKP